VKRLALVAVAPSCYHDVMTKNLTVRLPDDIAADAEAVARVEGTSVNETVKQALVEAIERRRKDPAFRTSLRRIVKEDQELLERLAK
jgi:hypothetical protein